jgi:Baseplate J-like protein
MPLPTPNLDDRDFKQLVEEAQLRIRQRCPTWTDLSPSDPGIVLLELFAFLTETMIYRLNRLPDKAYVEFLRLLGVRLQPPSAARTTLVFSLSRPSSTPVEIPRGTRVTTSRADAGAEPPIFYTSRPASIPPGQTTAEVLAFNCDVVEAELLGRGTGFPGLSFQVSRPPIVAPTGEDLDLVLAVEAAAGELDERSPAIQFGGKPYRVWREAENFANVGSERFVYIADRAAGMITFAPALMMPEGSSELSDTLTALAAIPTVGREIRVWYRRGGGQHGNVAAGTLTVLKDSVAPGLSVNNPKPATGGRSAESVENALTRGPQDLHSLQRAVTARDFEMLALRSSGAVVRAKAFTKAALWAYAQPGTVEVQLVPGMPQEPFEASQVRPATLQSQQTEEARSEIEKELNERRPLGTTCIVRWARYKTVRVEATVVAHPEESAGALKGRVLQRLYKSINPLPTELHGGWRFGQPLRVSDVYDIALREPGVNYVVQPKLLVEEVPDQQVASVAADPFHVSTWYVGSGDALFRSVNDADGWELCARFADQKITVIAPHMAVPGLVAVTTRPKDDSPGSWLYVSRDCGETWEQKARPEEFIVEDLAWTVRQNTPFILMATSAGLYELSMAPNAGPIRVEVRPGDQTYGYHAVAASTDVRGNVTVVLAAQRQGGVFLSHLGGDENTFRNIGLAGEDVRVLTVQEDGVRSFLWAGLAAPSPSDPGKGCYCWELLGSQDPAEGWQEFQNGWIGGSCHALAFQGEAIYAATYDAGVLKLAQRNDKAAWEASDVRSNLPLRSKEHPFEPINFVAAHSRGATVLAVNDSGVFRGKGTLTFESVSNRMFTDRVTLPPEWLFCSGEHELQVVYEDEARTT